MWWRLGELYETFDPEELGTLFFDLCALIELFLFT